MARGTLAGVLLRNEVLKTRKRLAFWVTLGFFAFIACMEFGEEFVRARRDPERVFALPGAWPQILGEETLLALIFGSVVLILLIASEFSWRTARQNVIDGLSKGQWFWGKALLLPLLGAAFIGVYLLIAGGFALAGTDLSALDGLPIGGAQLSLFGGWLAAFIGYGSLALAASMAIRGTGAAMAVWFFYVALGERLLAGGLGALSEGLRPILRFLPVNVFNGLHDYLQHDPAAFRAAVERAVEAGETPPEIWPWEALLSATAVWLAVFVLGSYAWFRRRDL